MSTRTDQFCHPNQPTLQDALEALRDGAIAAPRVAGTRAAVASFARLMQRPAAELPAHQGFIIRQMRRLRRQPTGLSPKTLSNTRSGLLYLVKMVVGRGSRSALALSEAWAGFRSTLSPDPAWWSLSRFGGFSSRQDVEPSGVDDTHIRRFLEALKQSGEVRIRPATHDA